MPSTDEIYIEPDATMPTASYEEIQNTAPLSNLSAEQNPSVPASIEEVRLSESSNLHIPTASLDYETRGLTASSERVRYKFR